MSRGDPLALEQLAQWRRAGFGIWHVTFIIEGYDDPETIIKPGRLSEKHAIMYAKKECAENLGTAQKWIHLQTLEKKG